jgi:EAL domain-containing protein (putative c-di-GMP-specific phosphodiesterase class I)
MSPLLSTRAPVSVNARLLGACLVTAALAALVAIWGDAGGRPTAAVPAALGAGAVCAALVAHLSFAGARAVPDPRLLWISAGVTVAFAGLLLNLLGQPTLFPDGGPVSRDADAAAARYLIWHGALLGAALLAIAKVPARPRTVAAYAAGGLVLLLYAALADAPFGDLAAPFGGYADATRIAAGVLAAGTLAAAAGWWGRTEGAPTWGEMCVVALLALSGIDLAAYLFASDPYAGAWWASLTLRAGQFAIPAVGLVLGFVAVGDRLRELQEELAQGLEDERERARREDELASLDRRERDHARERIQRLTDGHGLDVALQPIVDLVSRRVVGAEALARFTGPDGNALPTESTFLDAHAFGLGVELELAVIGRALTADSRLPPDLYLALNVSPALLADERLERAICPLEDRNIVVELTEHHAVEDYSGLTLALSRLREHGVRVAVDDVGSGFASFRHVTRVKPEILKLDRTLVAGIDEDPVRQSLAAAIVAFAGDVGAVVVSEGIESEDELACLMDLAIACGQGFYLARPNLGRVVESLG